MAGGSGKDPGGPTLSRRSLLAGGLLLAAAPLAAACGQAPAPPSGPSPTPAGATPPPTPSGPASPSPTALPPASPGPSPAPVRSDALAAENGLAGSAAWDRRRAIGAAEAYLGAASAAPGGAVVLHARGSGPVDVEWYRLGWYGGAGARLLRTDRAVALGRQPAARVDPATGLAEARWGPALTTTAPIGVPSGMLLAVLRDRAGRGVASVPLVLRPDPLAARRAPVLFVSAAATWQAYNPWAGVDLYANTAGAPVPPSRGRRAVRVSFGRPYQLDGGAGLLRRWEIQFVRWMERSGRDVEYIADVDLEQNPSLADGRRLLVMAGHPEYWSRPMRTRVEAAVASGTNVAFLTGNEVYWQVRLEDGPAGPGTRIVCYKSRTLDPMTASQPALTTCRWRDAPVSDPEATLVGQMSSGIVRRVRDWIVESPDHWLYEGTRLRSGDALRNLVGQEFDSLVPDLAPPGTVVLAASPVDRDVRGRGATPSPPAHATHNATVYTAQSGATVIAAGTFQWSWAIDGYGVRSYLGVRTPLDDRVARMTRNLFDRLGDGPLAP